MTDVTGGGPNTRSARSWTRWGLVATALLTLVVAQRSVIDDPWPPKLRAALLAATLGVVAVHVWTSGRALTGRNVTSPAVAAVMIALAVLVVVIMVGPDAAPTWLVLLGLAMSAVGMARGWRPSDARMAIAVIVLAGAVLAWLGAPSQLPGPLRPLLGVLVAVPIALDLSQFWMWRVVLRLDTARELASELAATRERARIAAELHDVQGHSLHVIAMRAELVDRLITRDPAAAGEHARAVRALAADALAETRSLVHGYRTGDVAADVRNAAQVLRAAGAEVVLHGDPADIPATAAGAFAVLIREATTNVLRHSTPDWVQIRVERTPGAVRVTVTNDGVHVGIGYTPGVGGTGVGGLRERFARIGGAVDAGLAGADGAGWTLSGTLPVDSTGKRAG